jgi:hypothetical protein
MSIQENKRPVESSPNPPEFKNPDELLDLQNHHTLYARLLIAGTLDKSRTDEIRTVLNPSTKLTEENIEDIKSNNYELLKHERNYNIATNGLSISERKRAWDDVIREHGFETAYKAWSSNLVDTINSSDSDQRKEFINRFFGKDHTSVTEEDIKNLYEKYCKKGSNIDAFVKKALNNPELNREEIEWLAKKLFGKTSGNVVRRIYEIESAYKSGGTDEVNKAIWEVDLVRLNEPKDEERLVLSSIFDNFEYSSKSIPKDKKGEAQSSGEKKEKERTESPSGDKRIRAGMVLGDRDNPDEKYYIKVIDDLALIQKLSTAIEAVKNKQTTLDPITNNLLDISTPEKSQETIQYLEEKLREAKDAKTELDEKTGQINKDDFREIEIIRIRDGITVEGGLGKGFRKIDLKDIIFRSEDPKYIRYKYERYKVKLKDIDHTYTVQTYYDANDKKVKIRFYRGPNMANPDHEKDKEIEIEEFEEMFKSGKIDIIGFPKLEPHTPNEPDQADSPAPMEAEKPSIKPKLKRKSDGKTFEPISDPFSSEQKFKSKDGEIITLDDSFLASGKWDVIIPEEEDPPVPVKTPDSNDRDEVLPGTFKAQETSPDTLDLVDSANENLSNSTQDFENIEFSPAQLSVYLDGISLPSGITFSKSPEVIIQDKKVEITMNLTNQGEEINLTSIIENDPTYGARVTEHSVNIPDSINLNQSTTEELKILASNLDKIIKNSISSQINQDWEVSSFNVTPEKLGINLRKKDRQTQKPSEINLNPPNQAQTIVEQTDQSSLKAEIDNTQEDDAIREARIKAEDEARKAKTALEDEQRISRTKAEDEERIKRLAMELGPAPTSPTTPQEPNSSDVITPKPANDISTAALNTTETVAAPDDSSVIESKAPPPTRKPEENTADESAKVEGIENKDAQAHEADVNVTEPASTNVEISALEAPKNSVPEGEEETSNPNLDFDTVSVPGYDWESALQAARVTNPGNNIYRQGSKFIREVVEPLIQGDIIPGDIKRRKDYSNLRRLQYDAAKDPENGVPLPTPDSLTS